MGRLFTLRNQRADWVASWFDDLLLAMQGRAWINPERIWAVALILAGASRWY